MILSFVIHPRYTKNIKPDSSSSSSSFSGSNSISTILEDPAWDSPTRKRKEAHVIMLSPLPYWYNGGFSFRLVYAAEFYILCRVTTLRSSPLLIERECCLLVLNLVSSTLPDSRIVTPLSFTLFSQHLLEVQKFDSESYHQFPPSLGSCPDTQVKTLVSFPSSSYYLLSSGKTAIFFIPKKV